MFRRVLWFSIGAGVGVFALAKARSYLQRATPKAVSARVIQTGAGWSASVQEFASSVRAAMAEREAELREAIGLSGAPDDGLSGAPDDGLSGAREDDLSRAPGQPASTGTPRRAADR